MRCCTNATFSALLFAALGAGLGSGCLIGVSLERHLATLPRQGESDVTPVDPTRTPAYPIELALRDDPDWSVRMRVAGVPAGHCWLDAGGRTHALLRDHVQIGWRDEKGYYYPLLGPGRFGRSAPLPPGVTVPNVAQPRRLED